MNTVDAVKLLDEFLSLRCVTGAEYAAWQTLKKVVLAKQSTNSRSKQSVDNALEVGDGSDY